LKNIRLLIEYDGTEYHGWQRQASSPTIQATLEDILSKITNKKVILYGASRTDSGVHAMGQVANFYTDYPLEEKKWRLVLNDHLPPAIRVLESQEKPSSFHSQKHAKGKEYRYRVLNRYFSSALERKVYFLPKPVKWEKVRAALPLFVGEKDFKAFQGAKADRLTTVRTITSCELIEEGDGFYSFKICGTGFLKQMVRSMVGTLIAIGMEKKDLKDIERALETGSRSLVGPTVPSSGLTLVKVFYEDKND
jgi:tRNA pseudouridine38-40 synthase